MKRLWYAGVALPLITATLLLPYAYVHYQMARYTYASASEAPTSTAALVLGASVYQSGELSPVLKARADRAAELYEAHKVSKILVSGDNGNLSHNEVNPVGKYLLTLGIPKSDIFLDHAGFDTYSSMYRARDIFGVHSLAIVSQPFHLPRALFIARSLGIDAVGVEAQGDPTLYNTLREILATFKAAFDIAVRRVPEYLGNPYLIEGDGSPTWADEAPLH